MAQKKSSSSVRMSIIVPVFNKSDYIEDCVKCLDTQTAPKKSFEVIIVDDGSQDDSLEKCQRVAKTHPHFKVLSQDNKGVSAARNLGIENAVGDYIMFLDPDDDVTPDTVSNLVDAFDSFGDSTDVVTYGLLLRYVETEEEERHKREKWLTETGLYWLEETPYIAQSTMNVCVRNRGENNILFDPELRLNGDQLYITENLREKATIGYCAEAEYTYSRDSSAASLQLDNPLYSYDEMIGCFEHLLAIAEENVFMRRYVYCLILHEVDQRMTSSKLFANHLSGAEREEADKRLAAIMSAIPNEEYAKNPYLDVFRKGYLLKTFKFSDADTQVLHASNHSLVAFDSEYIWMTAKPVINIERCQYYDSKLSIRGRLGGAALLFEEKPELVVSCGKTKHKVELSPSSHCYTSKKMPMLITKAWSFACQFDLKKVSKGTTIKFAASIGGRQMPSLKVVNSPLVHNSRLINKTRCFPGLEMDSRENELALFPRSPLEQRKTALNAARKDIGLTNARRKVAAYCKKHDGHRMWMYVDLPSSRAEGNALVAMLHDLREEDGIERYYISEHAEDLVKAHPILEGKVIDPDSDEHRFLSLRAEIIVCSYLERGTRSTRITRTSRSTNVACTSNTASSTRRSHGISRSTSSISMQRRSPPRWRNMPSETPMDSRRRPLSRAEHRASTISNTGPCGRARRSSSCPPGARTSSVEPQDAERARTRCSSRLRSTRA